MATLEIPGVKTVLGDGLLQFIGNLPDWSQPFPASDPVQILVRPAGAGLKLGSTSGLSLGLDAAVQAVLTPVLAEDAADHADLLADSGAPDYFAAGANAGRVLLRLDLGGNANVRAGLDVQQGALNAGASLKAGAEARYALLRSYDRQDAAEKIVRDLLAGLRLPADARSVAKDEVIVLEYGGQVSFAASLRAGVQLGRTASLDLQQFAVSEVLKLAIGGGFSVSAALAGQFRIELRRGLAASGKANEADWIRVTLRRERVADVGFAVDLGVTVSTEAKGLPATADELLAGMLGLNARSWLRLLKDAGSLTSKDALEERLDTLADAFVEKLTGRALKELTDRTELDEVLTRLQAIGKAYDTLDEKAVAWFEGFFDSETKAVDKALTAAFDAVGKLTSWTDLAGSVDPLVWRLLDHGTGGNPLGAIAEGGTQSLKTAIGKVAALRKGVEAAAASEIARVVDLARSEFPLDHLLKKLATLDAATLEKSADKRLRGIVERLIGKAVDRLAGSEVGAAVERVNRVLLSLETFRETAYGALKKALTQSLQFELQAGWHRRSASGVLLDFEVDASTDRGRALLHDAGLGDFSRVLQDLGQGGVVLHAGLLSESLTTEKTLSINVVGGLLNWSYQAIDRVIVRAEQHLTSDAAGRLVVDATYEAVSERERRHRNERMSAGLVLSFLGHASGARTLDDTQRAFILDQIRSVGARYALVFDDDSTTPAELAYYLSFADDFGLATSDEAARAALAPLLPRDTNGAFGRVSVSYDVRFDADGLDWLLPPLARAEDEEALRRIIRMSALAGALTGGRKLEEQRAWAYWTPATRAFWRKQGANFANNPQISVTPVSPSPFNNLQAPQSVTVSGVNVRLLDVLYRIEDEIVAAMKALGRIRSSGNVRPSEFQSALASFAHALLKFEDLDSGEATIFVLLDQVIRRNSGGTARRPASLTVEATLPGRATMTTMLVAPTA